MADLPVTGLVRAKAIYMEDERTDKAGRVHKVRQHVMPMEGMYSGAEAEHEAIRMARDLGVDESKMRVETYARGKAPMEANPRHRGLPRAFENRERTKQMVRHDQQDEMEVRQRHSFSMPGLPRTDEERDAVVAAFEARRAALNAAYAARNNP